MVPDCVGFGAWSLRGRRFLRFGVPWVFRTGTVASDRGGFSETEKDVFG